MFSFGKHSTPDDGDLLTEYIKLCRVSWILIYYPILLIISIALTITTYGTLFQSGISTIFFFLGCIVHSFWVFGLAFLCSTLFKSAATVNRVTHLTSILLFGSYFATGFLRSGIIYSLHPFIFYILCLVEPIAFGTYVQRVFMNFKNKVQKVWIDKNLS